MSSALPPTLFVAGTHPRVGKTTLCVALMRRAMELGGHPAAIKPVDANCSYGEDHDLVSPDGVRFASLRDRPMPPLVTVPYRFAQHTDPLEAAHKSGISLRLDHLEQAIRVAGEHGDVLFVELPGAIDAPLTDDGYGHELANRLNAPLVLLAGEPNSASAFTSALSIRAVIVNEGVHQESASGPHPPQPEVSTQGEGTFPALPPLNGDIDRASLNYVREHRVLERLFSSQKDR